MAEPREPAKVKLICGMISSRPQWLEEAIAALTDAFGPADVVGGAMPFDFTQYYDEEMSAPLQRQFISLAEEVSPDALADAKIKTNEIEAAFAARHTGQPRRPVNLDPGYVSPAKLVLASMKDFSHRIYLGRGVYAEVTLMHRKRRWEPLAWTFPDFASGRYDAFLTEAQDLLRTAGKEKA